MLFRSFVALMILTEWGARIAIKCHWLSATQNSPTEVCTLHLGFVSRLPYTIRSRKSFCAANLSSVIVI